MADELAAMPLFPLDTVLFPFAQLHLHVFEPRYREMISHCTQNDVGFGIVLIREGEETGDAEPYLVGTEVKIAKVQTYDDGKMDVCVRGKSRFRIRKLDRDSKTYLIGHVEPIVEGQVEESPGTEALAYSLVEHVEEYIRSEFEKHDVKIQQINLPNEPTALSFVIASLLRIENLEKQRLLETTDTVGRISDMIPILQQHITEVRTSSEARVTPEMMSEWISKN